MGGSGGHSDAAAESRMCLIVAPLLRNRIPLIRERVACISTPGRVVDVLVTQYGIAVNPKRDDLKQKFAEAGLPLKDIRELYDIAVSLTGKPEYPATDTEHVIADVFYRDGTLLDRLYRVKG